MSYDDNSRYAKAAQRAVAGPDGEAVVVTDPPPRVAEPVVGWHLRVQGQRLDQLAHRYLAAPTQWWRIADLNDAIWPDAAVEAPELAVPPRGRGG